MEGLSKSRECWGKVVAWYLGARHASPPSFLVALNLSWPWGLWGQHFSPWNGPTIFGWALSLPGCCPPLFFLPFLPFPPGGQGGNHSFAVSGGPVSDLVYKEAGLLFLPCLTSQLPKDCCDCEVQLLVSGTGCLGVMMPQWAASPHGGGSWCLELAISFQPPVSPSSSSLAALWRPLFMPLAVDRWHAGGGLTRLIA